MEQFDPKKAQRVWKRIQSVQKNDTSQTDLDAMITAAATARAVYLRLAQHELAGESVVLKKLAEKKQTQSACLNGMRLLAAGRTYHTAVPQITIHAPLTTLRRWCWNEIRTLREYELRIAERDFGSVYSELVTEQRLICRTILELVGRLDKN